MYSASLSHSLLGAPMNKDIGQLSYSKYKLQHAAGCAQILLTSAAGVLRVY